METRVTNDLATEYGWIIPGSYQVKCCGNWTDADGGTCPSCSTTFVVTDGADVDSYGPFADDSHDVRESPTRIRPYQARTVHYLGRLVYVSNAGTGNRVSVFTLQGTYGPSPARLVATSHRSR